MKHLWSSLTLALIGLTAPVLAQDVACPACDRDRAVELLSDGTEYIDDGDNDDAMLKEVEALLNEALLVDESGRVVFREEVRAMIPGDAMARAEMMLGALVRVGEDGRILFKDPEMVRPYLPMIRSFLDQGGLERMRELQKLPPEERREALRKLMEEQQGGGNGGGRMPNPFTPEVKPAPAPTPKATPKAEPEREQARPERERERERRHATPSEAPRAEQGGSVEERLSRIERALERIERKLDAEGSAPRARRPRLFERLFGGRDGGERMGDFGQRARVIARGLQKLAQLMQPEDMQRLMRAFGKLRQNVTAEDLRDTSRLMQKAQESVDPQDLGRFMEIFSDFLSSDEGREFVSEVEGMVRRLEELVNSPQGDALGKALERLGGGGNGKLRERIQKLIQGRDHEEQPAPQERHEGRRTERRHQDQPEGKTPAPQGPKPGSRPY